MSTNTIIDDMNAATDSAYYELFADHYDESGAYRFTEKMAQGPENYIKNSSIGEPYYRGGKSVKIVAPYGKYNKFKSNCLGSVNGIYRSQWAIENNM